MNLIPKTYPTVENNSKKSSSYLVAYFAILLTWSTCVGLLNTKALPSPNLYWGGM